MSGIITSGLGKSSNLVTSGYGWSLWEKLKKKVKEVIGWVVRHIPYERKPFRMLIKVTGDVGFPFKKEIPVAGAVSLPFKKEIPLRGVPDRSEFLRYLLESEEDEEGKKKERIGLDLAVRAEKLKAKIKALEIEGKSAEVEKKKLKKVKAWISKTLRFEGLLKDLEEAELAKDFQRVKKIKKEIEKIIHG